MMVDTLTIARELKATELPSDQAEAIAAAIGRSVAEGSATKADLETVRINLKADIDNVRTTLKADIDNVRTTFTAEFGAIRSEMREMEQRLIARMSSGQARLIMWFVGTQIAFLAILSTIIKL